jgi:hypothetical protein
MFFEKSELPATRTKYIGFFEKQLPHETRIPFVTSILLTVKITKPFQIVSQQVYAKEKSEVKIYAYIMMATPADEDIILCEMSHYRCSHTNFYVWGHFKDNKKTPLVERELVLNTMLSYARSNMSLLIGGYKQNTFMQYQMKKKRNDSTPALQTENEYAALNDKNDDEDDMDAVLRYNIVSANVEEDDLDNTLKDINLLDYVQEHFVDSIQEPVFTRYMDQLMIRLRFTMIK